MFLDQNVLAIIGASFGWPAAQTDSFINTHFTAILDMTLMKTFSYVERNLPEKKAELDKMIGMKDDKLTPPKSSKEAIKRYQTITDQLNLLLMSYPDLVQDVEADLYRFERDMFINYLKNGPDDGVIAVVDYFKTKIKHLDKLPQSLQLAKALIEDQKVNDVLHGKLDDASKGGDVGYDADQDSLPSS